MMKPSTQIHTLVLLSLWFSACSDPRGSQTKTKIVRIYPIDADYPTLPLTPLSPRF